jgi:hypothetical protein
MNKFIDYESFFTYISLILAFAIFIVLMYGCIADNYSGGSIIERFSTTEPVHAVISSITVDPTTKAITGITLGPNKGKYYKDRPPTITIPKPTVADSTQAEATAILKTTPIDGTTPAFYEIERIQITPGKAGTKYETADSSKITFGPIIAEYKAAAAAANTATEPVSAVIANITVDSATKGIKEITLGANKGKYYKDKPPLITIGAPTDTTGTAATAEVKLKPPIAGAELYEIDTITITNAGKNYVVSDSSKISLEPIDVYIARVNPVITLTDEQKNSIKELIDKCAALKNKAPYKNKIDTQTLRKTDVDAIIKEVGST